MPKRTQKLLVYLDQNFISEMAKADINKKVKPEWRELFLLLKEGFLDEKLVVPQSWFHDVETSLAPALKRRIVSYQCYLGQVDLENAEHVRIFQTARFLQRFLGKDEGDPLDIEVTFRDSPDQRVKQFKINVNMDMSQWGFDSRRSETAAVLESLRAGCVAKRVRFEDQLENELNAHSTDFLRDFRYYAHLCDNPARDLVAFSKDPVFRTMPVVSILSRLMAWVLTKCTTRRIQSGDSTDMEVLSTYLPYMDVVGTDAFMATLLSTLGIDKEHGVRVFNAKTKSLKAFCDFLRDYLRCAVPVNRPTICVFVLPTDSVKQNAFTLFRELGAASREFGCEEYAEIYGFDDGEMPRYQLKNTPGEFPFYGLQEVDPIKVERGTTLEQFLNICRERCKSDHFILIDEYQPIKKTFLVGAAMAADGGIQVIGGCRIYATRR